ncbi:MAG: lipase family protein [Candidatus Cohnella colombiensis]|uniref:Lipase family protein n=1 Tax=Candidatus Cohnella colombiensis TaxID=3121368 RepID=A0AA95JCK2_9BACL|nr:MAG: lipase family protein [Cohnella sp.]
MAVEGYSNQLAILLAALCSQTYAHFDNPKGDIIIPQGYEWVSEFSARSFAGIRERFGFILQSNDFIVVAFRGTSSMTDWISDAIASQIKYKYVKGAGQSHRGITTIYDSARRSIMETLRKLSSSKVLLITGHSLGGALATLCALDVAVNTDFQPPIVYSYGAPRVGDLDFARCYGVLVDQTYRIYNRFDVVPTLPPHVYKPPRSDTSFHYLHVRQGVELQFNKGSISTNHVISSYFHALVLFDPAYTINLEQTSPGISPEVERDTVQPQPAN